MPDYQWAVFQVDLDPVKGSEQRGLRPVLVVSNENSNQIMPIVTVLPLTLTRRLLYPYEVLLPKGSAGQPLDSIAMAHQIRAISKQRLGDIYGHLQDRLLRESVRQAVRDYLDLD